MELGKKHVIVLCTLLSIAVAHTEAACVLKKKILFEDVTPNTPADSKPESPPQPQSQTQKQETSNPTPPAETTLGAMKNALNPHLDDMKNALNQGADAVKGALNPDISKICDQADNKDLCSTTIGPLFTGKTDIVSVMDIMVKGCEAAATQAKEVALKLKVGANASNQKSFDNCITNFDDAMDYLKQGFAALKIKDISTAQTQFSAAISFTSTCDDNFSDEPDTEASANNPMEKIDQHLIDMIGNALAVLDKNKASI